MILVANEDHGGILRQIGIIYLEMAKLDEAIDIPSFNFPREEELYRYLLVAYIWAGKDVNMIRSLIDDYLKLYPKDKLLETFEHHQISMDEFY